PDGRIEQAATFRERGARAQHAQYKLLLSGRDAPAVRPGTREDGECEHPTGEARDAGCGDHRRRRTARPVHPCPRGAPAQSNTSHTEFTNVCRHRRIPGGIRCRDAESRLKIHTLCGELEAAARTASVTSSTATA